MNSIIEIGSKRSKGGRRYIKIALHSIYENSEDTNLNGIHWDKQYTIDNMSSLKDMPICCEFADDTMSVPLGHGQTEPTIDEEGNPIPLFENSVVVGVIEKGKIETITVDDEETEALVGEGYIYDQRYPNFVKWLKDSMADGKVKTSIEIMGTESNGNKIVYDGEATDEYRIPKEYVYSGTCILSVKEADENAIVLEAASLNTNKTKEREVNNMDEKTIALIADAVKNAVTETNAKNAEYETTITELNQTIAERDSKIVELNASVADIQAAIEAVKAEMEQARVQLDTAWEEKAALEKALGEAKAKERLGEFNTAIEGFTDEQKNFAKDEIDKFKADPVNVEINTVIDAIYRGIGKQAMDNKTTVVETNSVDIYGEVFHVDSNSNDCEEGSIY